MEYGGLRGAQYVRVGPEAARAVAPYVGRPAEEIEELVIDLVVWPEAIRPAPRRTYDGRLAAGDPVLLDASDVGLVFAGGDGAESALVLWRDVRGMDVLSPVGSA